jgi:DNA-binding PadR family transcriptional regulator
MPRSLSAVPVYLMTSWSERRDQAKLKGEDAKLLTLKYLSEPANATHGEILHRIWGAVCDAGTEIQSYAMRDVLKEMTADGLVEVRNSHPRNGNIRKPYRITQKGRDYLEEAMQPAPRVGEAEQGQDPPGSINLRAAPALQERAAHFVRGLPEFEDSGEARIQEVSRALAAAIARSSGRRR